MTSVFGQKKARLVHELTALGNLIPRKNINSGAELPVTTLLHGIS